MTDRDVIAEGICPRCETPLSRQDPPTCGNCGWPSFVWQQTKEMMAGVEGVKTTVRHPEDRVYDPISGFHYAEANDRPAGLTDVFPEIESERHESTATIKQLADDPNFPGALIAQGSREMTAPQICPRCETQIRPVRKLGSAICPQCSTVLPGVGQVGGVQKALMARNPVHPDDLAPSERSAT